MNTTTFGPNFGNMAGLGAIMAIGATVILVLSIILYVLYTVPFYKLFKKAGRPNAWLAFVPIAQLWPFMATIEQSAWNILWLLLPLAVTLLVGSMHSTLSFTIMLIADLVVLIISVLWYVKLFKVFGMSPLWLLLWIGLIIPGLNLLVLIGFLILLYVMAFSDKYPYQPYKI